jgi:hypothetical protein
MFLVIRGVLKSEISLFAGFAEIRVNSDEINKFLPLKPYALKSHQNNL